ncbi:enoyl-CoA hydratase [Nocardia mexicana]|uniref:Enoyl-CoA hydratase n=1 Tax=Nocardia mexicana TaxID=279262 RepID=A0A370GPB7_9NOCA|nr:enoyl-CoA hydratase [Nocardia mexicana]RDI45371.1 enoyl-CoA hydratase [Nocardia mexicana]
MDRDSISFSRIRYEVLDGRIARIVIARPEKRNAQDRKMLYELDRAFQRAALDDGVKVVILAAEGPHFSSGHDLFDSASLESLGGPIGLEGGFDQPAAHGQMATEQEIYLGLCWRWRNLPKPTIAQVQGKVIAGGLMLVWPCDIVIAGEDALFSDPVVAFGVNGHEFFVHAWEVGHRKAKEMLFRGNFLTADECRQLGMVNHVVSNGELSEFTLEIAREIATRPAMGLRLAKQSVNNSLDAQGQWTAVQSAFALHQLGHAHARCVNDGLSIDPAGIEIIRSMSTRK